jgi:GMP synthase-like glutamine amidotransferase
MASWWKLIANAAGTVPANQHSWEQGAMNVKAASGAKGNTYLAKLRNFTGGKQSHQSHKKSLVNPASVVKTAYGTNGSYGRQIRKSGI